MLRYLSQCYSAQSCAILSVYFFCFAQIPALAQVRFSAAEHVYHDDLYAALDEAIEYHDGDIIILFFSADDDRASRIDACMIPDERSASFISSNYTLAAVEIGSLEWKRLQMKYRRGVEADWPYVLVDIRRYLSHAEFHGWETCSGFIDPLESLQVMKRDGAIQGNIRDWKGTDNRR